MTDSEGGPRWTAKSLSVLAVVLAALFALVWLMFGASGVLGVAVCALVGGAIQYIGSRFSKQE